ncbi:MAG: Crp/Fnr family transcriptional regulator [Fimbriimonadaceae bacterium]|nr:Crp/Fnr family transcriptional regulator [Fimbriimonadaceae bacterium]
MTRLPCMFDFWLFAELTQAERSLLEDHATRQVWTPGEVVFAEGDEVTMVLLVTAGRLRLSRFSAHGRELVLGYLDPHDLVGEEALFRPATYPYTATACEPSHTCACRKADIEQLATREPALGARLTRRLGERLEQAVQLTDLGLYAVRERVLRVLVRLARERGSSDAAGRLVAPRVTQEELASLVGASRVMVSNALRDLREAGDVEPAAGRRLLLTATPQAALPPRRCRCDNDPDLLPCRPS